MYTFSIQGLPVRLCQLCFQDVEEAKVLADQIFESPFKTIPALGTLREATVEVSDLCVLALVFKVEAMLLQAAKGRVRKTQKEIVQLQFADIAGHDLDESLVHPALLTFGRSLLD